MERLAAKQEEGNGCISRLETHFLQEIRDTRQSIENTKQSLDRLHGAVTSLSAKQPGA